MVFDVLAPVAYVRGEKLLTDRSDSVTSREWRRCSYSPRGSSLPPSRSQQMRYWLYCLGAGEARWQTREIWGFENTHEAQGNSVLRDLLRIFSGKEKWLDLPRLFQSCCDHQVNEFCWSNQGLHHHQKFACNIGFNLSSMAFRWNNCSSFVSYPSILLFPVLLSICNWFF